MMMLIKPLYEQKHKLLIKFKEERQSTRRDYKKEKHFNRHKMTGKFTWQHLIKIFFGSLCTDYQLESTLI